MSPRPQAARAAFAVIAAFPFAACEPSAPVAPLDPRGVHATAASVGRSRMMPFTDGAALQDGERPFGAKLVWTTYAFVTVAQSGDPLFGGRCSVPSRYVEFGNLSGEITHAGRSEGTASHCVQGTPQTAITISDGTLTFSTANGDVLTENYGDGTVSLANGLFVLESRFSVTGGTGRFASASGAGTTHGEATATPGEVLRGAPIQFVQTGVITYAAGRGGP